MGVGRSATTWRFEQSPIAESPSSHEVAEGNVVIHPSVPHLQNPPKPKFFRRYPARVPKLASRNFVRVRDFLGDRRLLFGTPGHNCSLHNFCPQTFDFSDFVVSFAATVAGRYTRRGGPHLFVRGESLVVLTRGP